MSYKVNMAVHLTGVKKARSKFKNWKYQQKESKLLLCTLFLIEKGECPLCGKDMWLSFDNKYDKNKATFDHVTPLNKEQNQNPIVLRVVCAECNGKSNINSLDHKEKK